MLLHGKTALITGSNSGIGEAIAYAFAGEGAHLALNYFENEKKARSMVEELRAHVFEGQRAHAFHADIASHAQVQEMVNQVIELLGQIDILVNNAGVQTETAFLDLTESEVDRVLAVNLKGTFFVSQLVAREMVKHGTGKIINISSVHEKRPRSLVAHYAASKGGVKMLTRVMALELAPYGITVNGISPGAIETPMNEAVLRDPDVKESVLKKIPLRRFGKSHEVARLAVFLASSYSDYVTGSSYLIDGGLSLR